MGVSAAEERAVGGEREQVLPNATRPADRYFPCPDQRRAGSGCARRFQMGARRQKDQQDNAGERAHQHVESFEGGVLDYALVLTERQRSSSFSSPICAATEANASVGPRQRNSSTLANR